MVTAVRRFFLDSHAGLGHSAEMDDRELETTVQLAQLEPSDDERAELGRAVAVMLEHFDTMAEAPVDTLPPVAHVGDASHGLRADTPDGDGFAHLDIDPDGLVSAGEDSEDGYFTVPNVL